MGLINLNPKAKKNKKKEKINLNPNAKKDKKKADKGKKKGWYPGKKLAEAVKRARLKKVYKKEGMEKKAAKTKAKVKAKAPETGKVRAGAKGVKSTKGGEYVKYGKKSKAAKSFRSEFAAARKAGKTSFSWDGRSYSTARADDKKKVKVAKPKGKATATPKGKVAKPKGKATATPKKPVLKKWHPPMEASSPSPRIKSPAPKEEVKDKAKFATPKVEPFEATEEKYVTKKEEGGIVESNPYGWPTRDARDGGN